MIELGPSPPTPEHPYRAGRACEFLPHVLEALPVGIGLFELRRDAFTFRYGNREFARVLRLERVPDEGLTLGEIFNRAEHEAILELFQMVRVSGEPQSYFSAEPNAARPARSGTSTLTRFSTPARLATSWCLPS